jgi:NTP pyrophosphatase (non-canonical NTP hydrolase)
VAKILEKNDMKVFISWSGKRSQQLAIALSEWIKNVLDYVEPWVSDKDIAAGDRWAQEVAKELEASSFGIVCVTPENLESQWVSFEAGALAKSMQDSKVIPLLFDLDIRDLTGPLSQFQAKKVDKDGMCEVVQAINKSAAEDVRTSDDRAKMLSEALWANFEQALAEVPEGEAVEKQPRKQADILEELVEGVRGLESRMRGLDSDLSESGIRVKMRRRHFHPMLIEEFAHIAEEMGDASMSLLMLAGLMRETMPWVSEVLVDVYRKQESGDPVAANKAMDGLRRMLKLSRKGMMSEMMGSKEEHMMMMELPHLLERSFHRIQSAGVS